MISGVMCESEHPEYSRNEYPCTAPPVKFSVGAMSIPKKVDMVNSPPHYNKGGIECIDVIKAATTGLTGMEAVCTANIIKYIFRWKDKNGKVDVEKCRWYCNKLIEELEKEGAVDERTHY